MHLIQKQYFHNIIQPDVYKRQDFGISLMMRYCRNFDPIHQLELIDELLQENLSLIHI